LQSEDFYIRRNQWIWETFTALSTRRSPIDFLTVCEDLDHRGVLGELGGPAYITHLINQTPTSLNATAYSGMIEQNSVRRRMLSAANNLARLAYNQNQTVDNIIEEAEKSIFGINERHIHKDLKPIKEVIGSVYERIDTLSRQEGDIFGVPTGMGEIDKLLNGLQKSDLIIVAGRPGMGKTGFLLSVAKNAAQTHKKHVAIFSLEMSNEQLVQRILSQETRIDSQRLRAGKIEGDEWTRLTQALDVLSNLQIFLDDTPAITPMQLRTKCRRLHMEHRIDLVIIDYIQLMSGDSRVDNRVQEVSNISRNLKALARELNVPVLAAAQLSRAVEQRTDKKPILSDLRESGSLEQDADIVMFIHRPEAMEKDSVNKNLAEIIVAKHRNGPTNSGIQMVFLSNLARFESALQQKRP
jgi:replicative DNA helicase